MKYITKAYLFLCGKMGSFNIEIDVEYALNLMKGDIIDIQFEDDEENSFLKCNDDDYFKMRDISLYYIIISRGFHGENLCLNVEIYN